MLNWIEKLLGIESPSKKPEITDKEFQVNWGLFSEDADNSIAKLGYTKIEESPELAVYQKIEVYGRKMVNIYLSSDCVPLLTCYEQINGDAMALTGPELQAFANKLAFKTRIDWTPRVDLTAENS